MQKRESDSEQWQQYHERHTCSCLKDNGKIVVPDINCRYHSPKDSGCPK